MVLAEQKAKSIFTAHDRCDRCGAQAFVRVKMMAGELDFCGHHYTKHEKKLVEESYEVIDERDRINQKPDTTL